MAEETLEKVEIQAPQEDGDIESGRAKEKSEQKRELDATSSAYMKYFLKVYGVLALNFFFSMIAIYIMVSAKLFFETRTIDIWIFIIALVLAVLSYTFLYYTLQMTKKIVLVPLSIALYVYTAAMTVVVTYLAPKFVFLSAVVMYSLVAVTMGIVSLFVYTVAAKFCIKQGSKRWATVALSVGIPISIIYLAIVCFAGKRPIALPNAVLDVLLKNGSTLITDSAGVIQERFSTWRKLVIFIVSSALSGAFIVFLVIYSMRFLKKAQKPEDASSMRTIFNVYIYITLPAVGVMKAFNWIVKKTASAAKQTARKANQNEETTENTPRT